MTCVERLRAERDEALERVAVEIDRSMAIARDRDTLQEALAAVEARVAAILSAKPQAVETDHYGEVGFTRGLSEGYSRMRAAMHKAAETATSTPALEIRKKALEEAARVAASWETTARKIAGNEDEHERRVLHEVAADMARDIAAAAPLPTKGETND